MDNAQVTEAEELIEALSDEADLCRNDGANDIADLLDEARKWIARHRLERSEPKPWGYGWYELGGKKKASGYLPTIDYPRSEDVSEGPFPLYTTPPEPVAEIERLREALKRLSDERTLQTTIPEGPWTPEMVAEFQSKEVGHMRDLARAALGDAS